MYDAEKVYPKGYHPAIAVLTMDVQAFAPHISRTAAGGVKYYVTDFGISTKFEEGEERLVLGTYCQDETVPELSDVIPYDPFPVDLYTLGNVFKRDLVDVTIHCSCICSFESLTISLDIQKHQLLKATNSIYDQGRPEVTSDRCRGSTTIRRNGKAAANSCRPMET